MTVQTQTVEIDHRVYPAPKGGFHSPLIKWDGQRFQHEVVIEQAGTNNDDSTTIRYTKRGPDGVVIDTAAVRAGNDADGRPMKHDELGPLQVIIPPGAALGSIIVPYTAHGPNDPTHTTRVSPWGYVVLRDVYIPHTQGVDPDEVFGMELPQAPNPTPNPTPTTFTVEDIMVAMRREFGGSTNNIRQGLQDKAGDGVKALSDSLRARGLDQWIMDRMFQCLTSNWPNQFPIPHNADIPDTSGEG